MRLTSIKMSGFKSFVDPTSVSLPDKLTGIVGPNGCGKSNTIDAVRWVMGESSAKHLRGESMDDVIFTGSASRKPVSQASVELVFDNSDGSLGGEYAAYAEIALRREVTRDGQSRYLLNNTRCRRRDIRDIFLGTGLGPRSYAIIEQGMISRLIEAKPEELRVYLEEAAGISKYKERRRETENRIRHTRDNLDRLDDLREEVDKQLAHLKRQANTAERYRVLKEEEREVRGELLGLRWQHFEASVTAHDEVIREKALSFEKELTSQRQVESLIEQEREHKVTAQERFNAQQAQYYQLAADVSRLEQSIQHTRESRAQQSAELQQIEQSITDAERHLKEDQQRIGEIDQSMESDEPAYDQLQESARLSAQMLEQARVRLDEWQARWDSWSSRNNESTRVAQLERSRMDQLERGVSQLDTRLEKLIAEQESLDIHSLNAQLTEWISEEVNFAGEEERFSESLQAASEDLQTLRDDHQNTTNALNELRSKIQAGTGRLSSLEALQQAALGQNNSLGTRWLERESLNEQPRLAQQMTVQPGWEAAVERVLGSTLEAVCVDGLDDLARRLSEEITRESGNEDASGQVTLFEQQATATESSAAAGVTLLADCVSSALPVHSLLAGIQTAPTLDAALSRRSSLRAGESIVTPEGIWLGQSWIRVGEVDVKSGVLQREQEIKDLKATLETDEKSADKLNQSIDDINLRLQEHETRRDTLQHSFNEVMRQLASVKSSLVSGRRQLEQLHLRESKLAAEIEDTRQLREQDQEQILVSKEHRSEALAQIDQLTEEGELLREEQDALKEAFTDARQQSEQDRSKGQELAIRVESMRTARQTTAANLERVQAQLEQFRARRESLSLAIVEEDDDPVIRLEEELADVLSAHQTSETSLAKARDGLETIESRLREHEQNRVRLENLAGTIRDALQTKQMESQEARVRLKTVEEELTAGEFDREAILAALSSEATLPEWTRRMEDLERKIQRLGPINLAAIDEYEEQLTRKEYLDSQHADVTDALTTLEQAIARIDKETRTRFKDTFELVNAKVQEFFPRLFGGGNAHLEMTGDDLLSTGVSVLAQPPGKHVTNIHLLSGGEKALTAVAMVFAFFELNPSPFCMLDEVDAPLDDANVGRFCELVREMSERVQFIFITHNKITMELASHLMGVTMNEPGVSRLVAVDVDEAVELAGV